MAYNTSTGSRDFDDMRYQQDRDTQIDWDQDSISFKTNDITRVVIDNSAISASGDATFVGATVVGSTLNVSGATTLASDTTFTNISGSGTLQTVGAVVLGNSLVVSGNVGIGTPSATALLDVDGDAIFNKSALDKDFRVVSDGNQYMLFVDGGTDRVGIGGAAPAKDLHIQRTSGETTLRLQSGGSYSDIMQSGVNMFIQNAAGGGNIIFYDDAAERMRIDTDGNVGIGTNGPTDTLTVAGDISGSGTLQIVGNTFLGGNLEVSGTTSYSGGTTFTNISGSGTLQAVGATTLGNTLTVSGAVKVAQKIEHAGDPDTYIEFTTDSMAVVVGAEQMILAIEGGGGVQADKVTINNSSEDIDFQVKGSSVPNLIRTDAANNKVGIGMADATFASETLTVVGTISGSSTLQAVGNTFLGGTLSVSGTSTFSGISTHEAHPIFETGITIKNADASAGYINFYEQSSNGTNVCTFRGKSSMGNCTITLPGDTGTVVLEDNTVTLSNKTLTSPTITGASITATTISASSTLQAVGNTFLGGTLNVTGTLTAAGDSSLDGAVTINDAGADKDFRVETADESHMIFVEGSSNRVSIGDNTGSPGATLEVKNNASAGAFGVPLVQLNSNDTDKIALDINASNIDANVVDILADAVTTAKVINVSADGLTTGNALYVDDNSADTGTRNSALIIQNHASAIAATALTVQSDGGITGVKLDKNFSDTTAATVTGLQIDFDKTGTTTSNNTMYGLKIDMDNTTATDGTNTMYGLHVTPTLTHAAAAGLPVVYGVVATATGGTNGTGIAQAARFEAGGGALNYGIQLDVEDGGVDLRIESSADSGDYFQIATTTHGATTITTVDDDAAAADLTFNVDGDITLNPTGDFSVTGDTSTFSSANSTDPVIIIKNTANDAKSARLRFIKDKGAAGAADDEAGVIEFFADDASQDNICFASVTGSVAVHTNGQEGGKLTLNVASHDGEQQPGLLIVDGDAEDEVDVTIGNGAGSLTTIAGDMDLPTGCFALGSDASGDMYYRDADGLLTRIAAGGDNQVLTLDGAVPGWEAAAGGVSFNGSTANGLVTYGNASTADVESDILFNAGNLTMDASISGSGNLQMVGNTFIGGDLKASGSLRAKQIHITQHGFNSTSTAYQYVPFYSENEQGTPNYRSAMIAPFKGRLLRVLWRSQQDINPSEVTVGVFTGSMGNSGPNTVVAEHVVMAPIAGAYQVTTFNFTGSQHFIAGDTITIGVQSDANPGTQNATGVWEFDMSEI